MAGAGTRGAAAGGKRRNAGCGRGWPAQERGVRPRGLHTKAGAGTGPRVGGQGHATNFGGTTVRNWPNSRSSGIKLHGEVSKVQ